MGREGRFFLVQGIKSFVLFFAFLPVGESVTESVIIGWHFGRLAEPFGAFLCQRINGLICLNHFVMRFLLFAFLLKSSVLVAMLLFTNGFQPSKKTELSSLPTSLSIILTCKILAILVVTRSRFERSGCSKLVSGYLKNLWFKKQTSVHPHASQ